MIGIIDYGVGNISAFSNIYNRLNKPFVIVKTKNDLSNIKKLILPGVGSFDYTVKKFNQSGLRDSIDQLVLEEKIPILGICVGMQLMSESSEEGKLPGLGWVKGKVKSLVKGKQDSNDSRNNDPLPHMGWNELKINSKHRLLNGLNENRRFYFLHSYYFECHDPKNEIASTSYGLSFSSVIQSQNIFGIQCHPEKSHHNGVQLLKNFGEL